MISNGLNAAQYFVDRNLVHGRAAKVAVECGGERITYGEVAERVNRLGNALRSQYRVGPGDRVALLLLDSPAFVYSFFAAIKIGAVPVPINTLWKPAECEYVLNDTAARVAVVSERLLSQIEAIPAEKRANLSHVIVDRTSASPGSLSAIIERGSPELEAADTRETDVAVWLYSSGSTGAPKACMHLHRDMVLATDAFGKGVLGIKETDRSFSAARLFFAYGLGNALYMPFAVGATSILDPDRPTARHVLDVMARHRPTLFYWVPTGFAMLLAEPPSATDDRDFSSVRLATSAGEALPPAIYERFKARFGIEILDGIGATESMHTFISNRPGRVRPGSSGEIVPGYEARILDSNGNQVRPGEIGTLFVKGDTICVGYWNQPEKTRATLENGWLRTGDTFHQDADGYFWHHGRVDDMLKVGGLWVSPVEVEQALSEHPAVKECAVIGRADADGLVKPCAFVVATSDSTPGPGLAEALTQFVRERIADYKRPRWVEFVTELPRTATGKIQRFKLR